MKKWNILFLINTIKDEGFLKSKEVISFLKSKSCNIYVEKEYVHFLDYAESFEDQQIDCAIVLGGDGTILNFAHKYCDYSFPMFGINLGRVGCLTECSLKNVEEKLEMLLQGNYYIEERNTLLCEVKHNNGENVQVLCFNEVSIQRGRLIKMLLIEMLINNANLTSFYADGVIVATSTGSSAYNLASGGPLLLPTAKNFVITPLSPQQREITSLVVNDTDTISISINGENKRENYDVNKPIVVIDGCVMFEIEVNEKVIIKNSNKKLRIIKLNKDSSLFEPLFKVAMSTQK